MARRFRRGGKKPAAGGEGTGWSLDTDAILGSVKRGGGMARFATGAGVAGITFLGLMALLFVSCRQVSAGEACVVTRFGKVRSVAEPGLNFGIGNKYQCFSTRSLVYETVENPRESGADFTDFPVDARTRDGQQIDRVTYSVRFRLPPDRAATTFREVARTTDQIVERVVKFHSRSIVRNSMQEYPADKLYSSQIDDVVKEIEAEIRPELESKGLILEAFTIRKIDFNEAYEQAVNARQIAAENVKRAEQEALAAETKAKGEALAEIEKAKGDAEAQRLRAAAEAESIRLRGEALRLNPSVAQLEFFEAIKAGKVQFLPSNGIQTLLPVPTETPR
jgi:regulator of protease activity HflC (stomatin/prohibitin superfamily)